MEQAVTTLLASQMLVSSNPEITSQKKRLECYNRGPNYHSTKLSARMLNVAHEIPKRASHKIFSTARVISQALEEQDVSKSPFKDFSISANNCENRELQITVNVYGTKTQTTFDDVFSKLVAAAQPIPGFRRVKGGKTPNIPKEVLLHIIGSSKVNEQSIKRIINSTVAEYVKKEGLMVTKDLRVEQSFEELEAAFEPGKDFSFVAFIQLEETGSTKP